jgi:hypothetical protein
MAPFVLPLETSPDRQHKASLCQASLSSLNTRIRIIITLKINCSYDLRDFGLQPTKLLSIQSALFSRQFFWSMHVHLLACFTDMS